jgi:hypothetical protein
MFCEKLRAGGAGMDFAKQKSDTERERKILAGDFVSVFSENTRA